MSQTVHAADLADLRWRHRLVVVTGAEAAAAQRAARADDPAGWSERRLVLVELTGSRASIDGAPADLDVAAALSKLGLGEGAAVVLVGLDGGVKERRVAPFANGELYALIDAMPMRRR